MLKTAKTSSTKLETGQLKILRFITGEEIMGKVIEITDTEVVLEHPYAVGMTQQGVGIGPFTVTIDETVTEVPFSKSVIVSHYPPQPEFAEHWKSKSSPLVLPKQGIVTK